MLTKAAAIKFFLIGTLVTIISFLMLSFDTLKKIPEQTNEKNLTTSVKRGKSIWEENNCMGCHTIFGEGAYYAPELTKVTDRRTDEFLKLFLKDPQAMYPGKRKMVNYNFSNQQIEDLISFFHWIRNVDLNGFPPETMLEKELKEKSKITNNNIKEPEIINQICLTCHSYKNVGNKIGPDFEEISGKRDMEYIKQWIKDPKSIKPDALMPKLPLSEDTIDELAVFFTQIK